MTISNTVSSGSGQSTGKSFIPDYPQASFLQALAGHISDYADKTFAQYDNTFQPLQQGLINRGNQELSPGYQQQKAGQAIAGAGQLGEQARQGALRDLQSFGVGDPSNVGRRYALDTAERGKTAATEAGAANEAMLTARNEGRADQNQAIANEQANAARAASMHNTAMGLKYPPLGDNRQQTQSNQSQSHTQGPQPQQPKSPSNSNQGSGNGSGGGPGYQSGNGSGGGPGGAIIMPGSNMGSPGDGPIGQGVNSGTSDNLSGPAITDYSSTSPYIYGGQADPYANLYGGFNDPNNTNGGGYFDSGTGYQDSSGFSSGPNQIYDQPSTQTWDDWNNGAGDTVPVDNGSGDNFAPDDLAAGGPVIGYDSGGSVLQASGAIPAIYSPHAINIQHAMALRANNYAKRYAPGGAINLQPGGPAPVKASPSRGAKTDDIDAKVNAHEFVIPKDVAIFKGHEHFYKLMESARKTRLEYQTGTHKPPGSK